MLTMISMLPELIRILREKRAESLSWWVPVILILGTGLWAWYGVLKGDWIIIVSNGISTLINAAIVLLSVRYANKKIGY
jgi:MtN3 and saliva related transmembrane protein